MFTGWDGVTFVTMQLRQSQQIQMIWDKHHKVHDSPDRSQSSFIYISTLYMAAITCLSGLRRIRTTTTVFTYSFHFQCSYICVKTRHWSLSMVFGRTGFSIKLTWVLVVCTCSKSHFTEARLYMFEPSYCCILSPIRAWPGNYRRTKKFPNTCRPIQAACLGPRRLQLS